MSATPQNIEAEQQLPPIDGLRATLETDGYCWLRKDWSFEEFRSYCAGLGDIFFEADVRLGGERPRNFQLPQAIGFHTDHASAHTVAWYCVQPDADGGAMWLLDLAPITEALTSEELDALSRVRVPDNAIWSKGGDIPLCVRNNGHTDFHYVPWLSLKAPDTDAGSALSKLQKGIANAEKTDIITLDVQPGDAVIVDNHRVMHGRAAIRTESNRFLKRLWIRDQAN